MARGGGFSGGLSPFGGGSFGNLGQYDIGADLADLEVYRVEIAWGNGLATDDEYLAALTKALNATDPNTQRRESAQNKLDDATYRIGRSKAEDKGLDALVAFDQSALAKMQPDNVRYRDVSDSLDAELAQRRSRDYGNLIRDYNAGKASTQSLLSWVKTAIASISPDDPDYNNWIGTRDDLTDRIASEKDSKVYQDFQQGRMQSGEFLAYVEKRRDGFDRTSPDYADWDRRLEDARKQVNDTNQRKADTAFFNAYELGKKSDGDYLKYLRTRINGMKADDPDRPAWQQRLTQAAFSLAEDQLRFDVEKGKKPVSSLVSFYRGYRAQLNPGSAEWRTITRALDNLGSFRGGGGGGGGRTGSRSRGGSGGSSGAGSGSASGALTTKAIPKYGLEGAFDLMTINPYAPAKDQKAAREFFDLNYTALENARQRGDQVWLFYDPRKPGAAIEGRNPDGSPVLDKNGKPVMVRGSSYLPVSDDAFGQMNVLKAQYQFALAEIALADRNPAKYADHLRQGLNAQDKARLVNSQSIQKAYSDFYEKAQDGIDSAMRRGDWATVMNLSNDVTKQLRYEIQNPQLDDTRRDRLDRLGEKLAANPLIPKVDPATRRQIGGAIDLAGSTAANGNFAAVALNPGWHHVLDKVDANGSPDWGLAYDAVQDGSWEANHVEITTSYGGAAVRGEVAKRSAGTHLTVFVPTEDGMIRVDQSVQYLTFTDENGQVVKAYSLDGKTWVRSLSGTPPQVEVAGNLRNAPDGSGLIDDNGKPVFEAIEPGNKAAGYKFVGDPAILGWYGQSDRNARLFGERPMEIPTDYDAMLRGRMSMLRGRVSKLSDGSVVVYAPTPDDRAGKERDDITSSSGYIRRVQRHDLGAPGQEMQLLTTASDGSLTFLSDRQQDRQERQLLGRRNPGATRGGPRSTGTDAWKDNRNAIATGVAAGAKALDPWLSGVISFGLGLLPKSSPPKRVGTPARGLRNPEAPPALRALAAPTLGARGSSVLPPGKAKDDLALPKMTITPPKKTTTRKRATTPKAKAPPPPPRPTLARTSLVAS